MNTADVARAMRAAIISGGVYLNEVNRERDRYLAGLITVEELEERTAAILAAREADAKGRNDG